MTRTTRAFIVLIALIQGLLLYWAETGHQHGWWPFAMLGGRVCWYTLVLSVPTAILLSIQRIDDRSFWGCITGLTLLYALLAGWATWSATGGPGIESEYVLWPFGMAAGVLLFVCLPYLQCRLKHGRWIAPYPDLFELGWQNALALLLTGVFVAVCWAVLFLWSSLFALVKITFFKELFREQAFAYLATGIMVGLGILIARSQQAALTTARTILLAVFFGLLPLVAGVALGFVISLPFTGLSALWETRSAASILASLLVVLVLFTNAVFQDGRHSRPYPMILRRVVEAAWLISPVFAGLGLYAMALRIQQYGWSVGRFWGVCVLAILLLYAVGYAISVLRRTTVWMAGMQKVNVWVSWLIFGLVIATHSPLLDPFRLSTNNQIHRLHAGQTALADFDMTTLRFEFGRRGYEAALALREDPLIRDDAEMRDTLERLLARTERYPRYSNDTAKNALSVDALREQLQRVPGTPVPEEAWFNVLLALDNGQHACVQPGAECVLLERDLDDDGQSERLLCNVGEGWAIDCQVFVHGLDQVWDLAGNAQWYLEPKKKAQIVRALRNGEMQIVPPRWPNLTILGREARVEPCCQAIPISSWIPEPPETAVDAAQSPQEAGQETP